MGKQTAWNVYSASGKLIDTVYYDENISGVEVKTSLCNHDGYSWHIFVIKRGM